MKAQASLEQLFMLGIGLIFLIVTFYVAATYASDTLRISQAEDAVGRLAAAADYVYSLGPNSREYVDVYLPDSIMEMNVSGRRILLRVGISSGTTDVFATTHADLIGALPAARGKQRILVQYLENGKVLLGEAGLSCAPSLLSRAFNQTDSGSDQVTVRNAAYFTIDGITATLSGPVTAIASISQPADSLETAQSSEVTVNYNVPDGQPLGTYGGTLLVESENDGACVTEINVRVNGASTCTGLCMAQGYVSGMCRESAGDCIRSAEDYMSGNDYACLVQPRCCCSPTHDKKGPVVSMINNTPENATVAENITIHAICNDSATGGSYIYSARVHIDNGSWTDMQADDAAFSHLVVEEVNLPVGRLTVGQHIAWVQCTDTANNSGPIAFYYFNVSMADVIGPIITYMNHTAYPTTLANITTSGSTTDQYTGDHDIEGCRVKVDYGDWYEAEPSDGAWDSPTEDYTYNIGPLAVGYHVVYAQCRDTKNNSGGVYNMSFGVVDVDLMLVLDKSPSMLWAVTNVSSFTVVNTPNTGFTLVKTLAVSATNGKYANMTTEIMANRSGCTAYYEIRIGSDVIASGNRTSTSYGKIEDVNVDMSSYSPPFNLLLYLKRSAGTSCLAYNRRFSIQQLPDKLYAAQNASKTFVDIVSETTNAGFGTYCYSGSLDLQLDVMDSAAKTVMKDEIDAIITCSSTCIECGLEIGADELASARGRPNATRVIVLLTDGQGNVGDSVAGAVYCRDRNITVYTIGFGNDVDDSELTNIALLTNGEYYFAPDAQTLQEIFMNIGK